jgi:hypothetical protein
LSYLIGSEFHYGQATNNACSDFDLLVVTSNEALLLIELLSNCIHSRPKEGPGGYSSSSFSLKGILYSIRCLVAERRNRLQFASTGGARLNALLLKALAQYSFSDQKDEGINVLMDAEAAEHAVVSLYLMSNYGFHVSTCSYLHLRVVSRSELTDSAIFCS